MMSIIIFCSWIVLAHSVPCVLGFMLYACIYTVHVGYRIINFHLILIMIASSSRVLCTMVSVQHVHAHCMAA